jgi:uncharacterized protein DUF5995
MRRGAFTAGLMAALVMAAPAGASKHPANVHWEYLLPAMPSSTEVQAHSVPFCRRATVRCIDTQIKRMRRMQKMLGCDHRAVFDTTYLQLTLTIRQVLRENPRFFRYPRYLFVEDALFANIYFNTIRDRVAGRAVPPAWQIAFDTAARGDANAGQDMLLGINAHVQNDMPFVLAALGLRTPAGESRKPDHDRANEMLDRGYEAVVKEIAERFDPLLFTTNADWNPIDDVAGLEVVRGWREGVWRNAERLLAATSDEERREVAHQIQQNAAMWAEMMAAPGGPPGYRAQRDGYCARR